MRRLIIVFLCLISVLSHAQVHMKIGAGAHVAVSGFPQVVMDTGSFENDGVYHDSSGMFRANGGVMFSGTGTTDMLYLKFDNAQFSEISSPVSVYHTATLGPLAKLNANNKLHIRSDANNTANMVVHGELTNNVLGIIARATLTTSCNPFTSDLTLNISGSAMEYQWQSSTDSVTWSNIAGALGATYTASVISTAFYRCALSTNNTTFNQNTPGVKLTMDFDGITGDSVVCVGTSGALANSTPGGTWISSAPSVVTVGSASGVLTGVSNGSATITYTLASGCYRVKQVTVGLPAITGTTNICIGSTSTLNNSVPGGTWSSASPYYASVDAATGVVTGVHVGTTTITYTASAGCYVTATVNVPNILLNITGGLVSCPGRNTTLVCAGYPGGTWTSAVPAIATVNASTGVMTGVAAGTATITYTYAYCFKTAVATINPSPLPVTGSSAVCVGNVTTMSCVSAGGVWSSSNTTKATVDAAGLVTGLTAGTTRISYTISTGCASFQVLTVGAMPTLITGTTSICEGSLSTLTCGPAGGTWSSSDTSTATVSAITGVSASVAGMHTGVVAISYNTAGGCTRTTDVTVNPSPGPITGSLAICVGSTSSLSAGTPGGNWSSSSPPVAAVVLSSGVVTGHSAGTANISYRMTASCYAVAQVTVDAPGAITGAAAVCVGASTTLTPPVVGGTWMSSNTARATVDAVTGTVTGLTPGYVNIRYVLSSSCYVVKPMTVYPNPSPISGPATVCEGASVTVSSSAGGVWSITDPSVATMAGNVVTGVHTGVATISYVLTSTGCLATRNISVNTMPASITGSTPICVGDVSSYSSSPSGGTWTSTAPAVGSVDATSGVVTGRAGGATIIRYTLPSGCQVAKPITVNVLPAAISGTLLVCVGNTVTLSSTTSGATWTISDSSVAAITATTSTTATIGGATAGYTTLSYTNANGCYRTAAMTVNPAVAPIAGADTVCGANTVVFSSATPGGTWMSNATTKAMVGAGTGVVTGNAAGTSMITYTLSAGCKVWKGVTVTAAVTAIAGATNVCEGSSTTFTHGTPGGTWSSATPAIAAVGSSSGVVSGVSAGTAAISYILSEGCYKTKPIMIKMLPVITGASTLEVGFADTFTAIPTGGAWATSASGIAHVSGYGVVSGVSVGSATISYTAAGCVGTTAIEILPSSSLKPGATALQDGIFHVFPNPSHGSLSVNTSVAGTLAIYTIDGRQVLSRLLMAGTSDLSLPATLAGGVYLCRFSGNDGGLHAVRLVFEP